jgi:hypothetical protein
MFSLEAVVAGGILLFVALSTVLIVRPDHVIDRARREADDKALREVYTQFIASSVEREETACVQSHELLDFDVSLEKYPEKEFRLVLIDGGLWLEMCGEEGKRLPLGVGRSS